MPADLTIIRPVCLPLPGFTVLEDEATADGHIFLTRMQTEWTNAANRFDGLGECLMGVFTDDSLIAIGGLNRDPYAHTDHIGRLRHLYVLRDHRRQGIARRLVAELLTRNTHFRTIRLRTPNAEAGRFYETLGFTPLDATDATHAITANNLKSPTS